MKDFIRLFTLFLISILLVVGLLTCVKEALAAPRIPVYRYRHTSLSEAQDNAAWTLANQVWNKSFRCKLREQRHSTIDFDLPMTREVWRTYLHIHRASAYLYGHGEDQDNRISLFTFPLLEDKYYAGLGYVASFLSGIPEPLPVCTAHIGRSLDDSARVLAHELGHVYLFTHTKRGLMSASAWPFHFTKLTIRRANRQCRKWKKGGLL